MCRSTRAAIAAGLQPGDRAAIWAPNIARVDHRRARRPRRGRRARARQHPLQGRRSRVRARQDRRAGCCSPSTASSTPTTSRCCGPRATDLPALERDRRARGATRPTARSPWADYLAAGDAVPAADAERAHRRHPGRRPLRHHLHVGHDRPPEGRDGHARPDAARLRGVDRRRRPARGRPLPHRQPVLPHLRLQGRLDVVRSCAARRSSRTRCSTSRRCSTGSQRERITVLPGPPTLLQGILDSPRARPLRPLVAAPHRHRRRRRSRSSSSSACATR